MLKWLLFDWGDTLMYNNPSYIGEMVLWPEIALMEGVLSMLPKLADEYRCAAVPTRRIPTRPPYYPHPSRNTHGHECVVLEDSE